MRYHARTSIKQRDITATLPCALPTKLSIIESMLYIGININLKCMMQHLRKAELIARF